MKRIAAIAAAFFSAAAIAFFLLLFRGHVPEESDFRSDNGPDATRATLARGKPGAKRAAGMAAPGEAIGRVMAIGGGPIVGAHVRATDFGDGVDRAAFGEGAAVATDAAGHFHLTGVSVGGAVFVSAGGFLGRLAAVDPFGAPIEVSLQKADGRVEGFVYDTKGAAVAGALVQVGDARKGLGVGRSDEEGRFAVPAEVTTDDATPWVAIWAAGFQPWGGSAPAFDADGVSHVNLRLAAGILFTVHVVDAESGAPVAGAVVEQGHSPAGEAKTDANGLVSWTAGPDIVVVDVAADGFEDSSIDVGRAEGATAALVEVRLRPFVAFEGVVLDETGSPLAGADVMVWGGRRTTSGPGGAFRVEGPSPGDRSMAVLAARAGERTPAFARVAMERRTGIELRLGAPAIFSGVVVDPTGAPMPLARILLTPVGIGPVPALELFDLPSEIPVPLDGAAAFRVAGLAAGTWTVHAHADANPASWSANTAMRIRAGKTTERRIVLDVGTTLRGRVVDRDGKPVAGANVRCTVPSRDIDEAVSGADGTFRVEGVPDRPVDVAVAKDGYSAWDDRVDPHDGDTTVVLEPPPTKTLIHVRFTGAAFRHDRLFAARIFPQGNPSAGRNVAASVNDDEVVIDAPTMWPMAGLFVTTDDAYGEAAAFPIVLGFDARVDIELRPMLEITGVVRGVDGKPLGGASVSVTRERLTRDAVGMGWDGTLGMGTDAEGRFRVLGLLPGSCSIRVSKEGHVTQSATVAAGGADLAFDLVPAATLVFSLKLNDQGPAALYDVSVEVLATEGTTSGPVAIEQGRSYAFEARVEPGVYLASAVRGTARGPAVRVAAKVGETVGPIALELPRLERIPSLTIEGRVLDASGDPTAYATVSFHPQEFDDSRAPVSTNSDGRFTSPPLAPGRYRVTVVGPGGTAEAAGIAAGTTDLVLTLVNPGEIRGRITGPWREMPMPGEVMLLRADGVAGFWSVEAKADGRFGLESAPPGVYRIVARAGAFVGAAQEPVTIAAGGLVRGVSIAMAPGATLVVTYVDEHGRPISGAGLICSPPGAALPSPPPATTDADGVCRFEGLLPGSWLVLTQRLALASSRVDVTSSGAAVRLVAGQTAPRGR